MYDEKDEKNIALVSSGDIFGEQSLINDSPRNASVYSLTECELLVMEKEFFKICISKFQTFNQSIKKYEKVIFKFNEIIKGISIFKDLSEKKIDEIVKSIKFRILKKDEILFNEGDIGNEFYIIKSGVIEIYSKEKTITKLSQNEFFGEIALYEKARRNASAKAICDTALFVINQEDFQLIFKKNSLIKRITSRRKKELHFK